MAISGTSLYSVVLGGNSQQLAATLADLKAHVKKDNVDLSFVPKYFEALSIVLDAEDSSLQSVAFSLVCHLVKRVSIQDKNASVLAAQAFLVLPILIPRIADARPSFKLAARKALEAFWLSSPETVDSAIIDVGLENRSSLLINECVVWLNHILGAINPHFKLDPFLRPLADALAKHAADEKLVANVRILFENYYDLKENRLHKYELQKVLEAADVNPRVRSSIMGTDSVLLPEPASLSPAQPVKRPSFSDRSVPVSARDVPKTAQDIASSQMPGTQPFKTSSLDTSNSTSNASPSTSSMESSLPEPSSDLDDLLHSITGFKKDDSIQPLNVHSAEAIEDLISEMFPAFSSKETEKNWSAREKNILQLRALCRGNAVSDFCSETLACVKEVADGICKCLLSLRTTLSVNACQLVKELALACGSSFDSVFDLFFSTLVKLSSSTKGLAHSNSHVAMSAILSQCTINGKILQKVMSTAFEKSVNTKSYAAFWFSVVLLRSSKPLALSMTEVADKMLARLLTDPNMQVRQSAKDAFWRYYSISSFAAEALQQRLDSNTIKALERSKPTSVGKLGPSAMKKSRPSIKDSIIAKNKELRGKQSISRSNSRLKASSATPSLDFSIGSEVASETSMGKYFTEPPNLKLPTQTKSQSLNRPDLRKDSDSFTKLHQFKLEPDTPHYAQPTFSHKSVNTTYSSADETPKKHLTKTSASPFPESKAPSRHSTDRYSISNDPITKFLSSPQEELVKEGMKLLKYAVLGGEEISPRISSLLHKVSISKPLLVGILLNDTEKLLRKSRKLFNAEDFIRVFAINKDTTDEDIDILLGLLSASEVYDAVELLVSFISDLDNIIDEKLLAMQIIKYKSSILSTLLKVSIKASFKVPITDIKFTKLVSSLFELVPVIHQTQLVDEFQTLLRSLHAINAVLFVSQLSSASRSIKTEIDHLVGIDNVLEYKNTDVTIPNVNELTQVVPGMDLYKLSPLKNPIDFTMLLPQKCDASSPSDKALHSDVKHSNTNASPFKKLEVDALDAVPKMEHPSDVSENVMIEPFKAQERDQEMDERDQKEEHGPEKEPDQAAEQEGQDDMSNMEFERAVSDNHAETKALFKSSDSSNELVEDFAQVRLSNRANSIETFIEKVDPLNKISSRNKPISIFEDNNMGSPQKVSQYSYTDLNWFNFSIAKIALDQAYIRIDDFSINEFQRLTGDFWSGQLTDALFAVFMKYLQVSVSHEFHQYLSQEGFSLAEKALWGYVSSANPDPFNALMVLKQLLVCRYSLALDVLWSSLVEISQMNTSDCHHALNLAVVEAFEEALCGLYSSSSLLDIVTKTLTNAEFMNDAALDFNLACLYKLVSNKSLVLSINEALVVSIDDVLHAYIAHPRVEVRKVVIETYGKLLRAARMSHSCNGSLSGDNSLFSYMREVTGPQRKMIEYFSA